MYKFEILILGNGGIKSTRTYNEDSELNGYVLDLQQFEALLKEAEKDGSIRVEETSIIGKKKNISQKELAKRMGKTEAEVSRWLGGTHNFTLRTIAKISNALGINLIIV